ncbi:MAG: TetR/AcrR family transcriptional regulator [Fibrobacteraceae bacterium]|nr:TetR/AcrR family transcriptional regulator [Fibrobacteraceae bacterium]
MLDFSQPGKEDIKESRRVIITKRMLKEAVVELLNEGEAKQLSVRSICLRAGVNRSTFYAHYPDQDTLLTEMTQETIQAAQAFASTWFGKESYRNNLVNMLEYYKAHASFFLSLLRTDFTIPFIQCIESSIWEQYCQKKIARGLTPTENDRYGIAFTTAGSVNVIARWLTKESPKESTEEIANILLNLFGKIRFQVK